MLLGMDDLGFKKLYEIELHGVELIEALYDEVLLFLILHLHELTLLIQE
jgi:hypothetical protein